MLSEGMLANALRQLATFKFLPYSLPWQSGAGKSSVLFIILVSLSFQTLSNGNPDGTRTVENALLVWDSRGGRLRILFGPVVRLTTEPTKDNSKRMNMSRMMKCQGMQ